ncbi:hypothetical protein CLM62_08580 [Streptomyces sp. SA15]|nr:hypothetical protein CLM62_08580 [Streptomyces sp. SA15]
MAQIRPKLAHTSFTELSAGSAVPVDLDDLLNMVHLRRHSHVVIGDIALVLPGSLPHRRRQLTSGMEGEEDAADGCCRAVSSRAVRGRWRPPCVQGPPAALPSQRLVHRFHRKGHVPSAHW